MALPKTETFTQTNGTQVSAISGWSTQGSDLDVQSNSAAPDAAGSEVAAYWDGDGAFNNDQYSEGPLVAIAAALYVGVAVRHSNAAETYYGFYVASADQYLFENIAGSWNEIGTSGGDSLSGTEVIRIEVSGTSVTAKIDSVAKCASPITDNSIASGYGGICGYDDGTTSRIDTVVMGNLAGGTEYQQGAAGALTPAGAIARLTGTPKAGTFAPSGAIARLVSTTKTGALTPTGAISRDTSTTKAGALTPSGATVKQTAKGAFAGALGLSGLISRGTSTTKAGTLAPTGATTKATTKAAFAGSLGLAGALGTVRLFLKALAGALGLAGAISRQTGKGTAGTLTPSGAIARAISITVSGTVGLAGTVARAISVTLAGALGLAGALATSLTEAVTTFVELTLHPRSTALTLLSRDTDLTLHTRSTGLTVDDR